jgi:hypothetical protein
MTESFTIRAKPALKNINKSIFNILSLSLSSFLSLDFILKGGPFFQLRNVYLSASNQNMFDGITFFNPFSGVKNLSAENPEFNAVLLSEFFYNENYVFFTLPQIPQVGGFFDVIIENEAGYGRLTTSPLVSSGVEVIYNI